MSNKYPGGLITSGANAGYSAYFGGTSGFLTTASNAAFTFGTGDFTVEFWCYPISSTGAGGYAYLYAQGPNTTAAFGIYFEGGVFKVWNGSAVITGTTSRTTSNWYHVAVSRSGTSMRLFVNGVQDGSTATNSSNITTGSTYGANIGRWAEISDVNYLVGYMSNVRVLKGTALYTAAFTPPTQLFAITNTSLLTCNSPAIVDQSSNAFAITANGNAAVSTFTPFTGTQLVPNPNTLANTQGVWSISDAAYWMSQNKWPMPPSYPLQSLRFNSADSAYLSRTPASAGNRKTWTWSGWVKKPELTALRYNLFGTGQNGGTNQFNILYYDQYLLIVGLDGGTTLNLQTSSIYRDVSSWYHIVVAVDTTQATSSNRIKLYVNGVQVTNFSTAIYPSQNYDTWINTALPHAIGAYAFTNASGAADYFSGYMADINFVDGQALTPSSFGANDPNTGVWSPVPYSGTYGTNGFRLSFQNNTGTTATTLGKDYSGNGNNWTPNNFSVAAGSGNDSLTDGPTNWGIDYGNGGEVRGNYATFNPLVTSNPGGGYTGSTAVLSNGNLTFAGAGAADYLSNSTVAFPSSGKWYCEITLETLATTTKVFRWGMSDASMAPSSNGLGFYINNGGLAGNQNVLSVPGTTQNIQLTGLNYTQAANDVLQIAYDADTGRAWVGIKNQWVGTSLTSYTGAPASGGSPTYTFTAGTQMFPYATVYGSATTCHINFGQRPFAYPAPSGFKVLCTTNLPIPTVGATSTTQADDYFNAVAYSGNSSTQTITTGFQPDLVWIKSRSTADIHSLQDVLRGARYYLISNSTAAEATQPDSDGVSSFTSTGFSLGYTDSDAWNKTGNTYISWAWKANGAGSSNTAGSITSTVSANQTAGISIVTYTGTGANATVGHGLGVAPRMIIIKSRSQVRDWIVYHASVGNTGALFLNGTNATDTNSAYWNNTTPSSTVFSLGTTLAGNSSGATQVAYCFAEIAGFSKFGSYTGNGSADGAFVYCGFRPKYVMFRRSDSAASWVINDSSRSPYNVANNILYAESSSAEVNAGTGAVVDFLSNGFKLRNGNADYGASGGTYIFMAFAESPFNYSRAR